jgi:Fe-S cluster biosynthesis and repair protein YggX
VSNDNPLSPTEDGEKVNQDISKQVLATLKKQPVFINKKTKEIYIQEGTSAIEAYNYIQDQLYQVHTDEDILDISDLDMCYLSERTVGTDIYIRVLETYIDSDWTFNGQKEYRLDVSSIDLAQ